MTLEQYEKVKNENQSIYFRTETIPFNAPENYPTMNAYALDTRLHEGFLYHRDDETFKFPMASLETCESWDVWHPKCPNCGTLCMALHTHYDDNVYQGRCPSCCAHGRAVGTWESKTAEKDAYKSFFHPTEGRVGDLQFWPDKDGDFKYSIILRSNGQYTATFNEDYPNPYKKKKFYKTLDLAKQACIKDFQRRTHKKAKSWGYVKLADDEVIVKKSDLCAGCRYSLLGEASPPDAAEFYQEADPGPFFHEHNK